MNKSRLKQLLECYYRGETSLEEEQLLISYFRETTDVPEEFQEDVALFKEIDELDVESSLPAPFEQKLNLWMEQKIAEEGQVKRPLFSRKIIGISLATAAAIAIAFTAKFSLLTPSQEPNIIYADSQQATELTAKALTIVFQKLNQGVEEVELTNRKIEDIALVINKIKKSR